MQPKNGKRTEYPSGALRSNRTGRGRYDLISPFGLKRLAIQYEEGGIQKGDRNWEQGFPISRALCSAIGHLMDQLTGDRSEDHLAAASWQLFAAMHFEELIEQGKLPVELNDIPFDANTLPPDTSVERMKFYVIRTNNTHIWYNILVSDGNAGELCMPKAEFLQLVTQLGDHIEVKYPDTEVALEPVVTELYQQQSFPFARMVEEPFGEIQRMTGSWSNHKFPQTDSVAVCKHLKREIDELTTAVADDAAISIEVEAADCLLILMHLAHKTGFNLLSAAIDKYVVNLGRTWATEPDADGIYPHIKENNES